MPETTLNDSAHRDSFGSVEGLVEKLAQGPAAKFAVCPDEASRGVPCYLGDKDEARMAGLRRKRVRVTDCSDALPAPVCPCPSVTSPTSRCLSRRSRISETSGASCQRLATASPRRSSERPGLTSDRHRLCSDSCCLISCLDVARHVQSCAVTGMQAIPDRLRAGAAGAEASSTPTEHIGLRREHIGAETEHVGPKSEHIRAKTEHFDANTVNTPCSRVVARRQRHRRPTAG